MFTGLVEATGEVLEVRRDGAMTRMQIALGELARETLPGDSIAVSGVCLTVAALESDRGAFEVVPETLRRTTLAQVRPGARVNLERALRLGDRLGGHLVQGHVDGTAVVAALDRSTQDVLLRLDLTPELRRGLVAKGSIAIDGVSLTVAGLDSASVSVALIPHTLAITNLGDRRPGERVNIELDMLGKWVREIVEPYLSQLPVRATGSP